jgi:hypothetical protein
MGLPGKKSRRDCGSLGCVDKEGRRVGRVSWWAARRSDIGRRFSHGANFQGADRLARKGGEGKGRVG